MYKLGLQPFHRALLVCHSDISRYFFGIPFSTGVMEAEAVMIWSCDYQIIIFSCKHVWA